MMNTVCIWTNLGLNYLNFIVEGWILKKIIVVIFQQYIEERYTITWRLWIIFKSKKFVPMKVILWNNNLKGKKIILLRRTFFFMHFKWLLAFTIIKYIFISTYHILHAFTHYNSSYRKFIAFEKWFLFFLFLVFYFVLRRGTYTCIWPSEHYNDIQ